MAAQEVEQGRFDALDAAYRAAFREWAHRMKDKSSQGESPVSVGEVEGAYRERRNRLARFILAMERADLQEEIRQVAYHLWEQAGRPAGTAESDWYRAELLVLGDAARITRRADPTRAKTRGSCAS